MTETAQMENLKIGPAKGHVVIGDASETPALVEIPFENLSEEPQSIQIICTLRYGADEKALLARKGDYIAVSAVQPNSDPITLKPATTSLPDGELGWMTGFRPLDAISLGPDATLSIRLEKFVSATPPGKAILKVGIRVQGEKGWQPDRLEEVEYHSVEITKTQKEESEPTIDYFQISSDFLAGSGEKISVSFRARNYDSCTLYRNNRQIRTWTDDGTHVIEERPSITTTYRLDARKSQEDEPATVLYRTVQVLAAGWNTLRAPQGYPTQLFVQSDLQSSMVGAPERLYGIFKDGKKSRLFSSADGIDDWRDENANTPKGMEESPGIAFDNRLWLIGGSSFDDNKPGCKVYCYERKSNNDGENLAREWVAKPDLPAILSGHECCLLPGSPPRLAVIGGDNNGTYFDKVHILTDGEWQTASSSVLGSGLTAAAVQSPIGESWKLYAHKGQIQEQNQPSRLSSDICSLQINGGTLDWSKWEKQVPMRPHQGYPLGAAMVTLPSTQEVLAKAVSPRDNANQATGRHRLFLLGTFLLPDPDAGPVPPDQISLGPPDEGLEEGSNVTVSRMLEWHSTERRWEGHEVARGWETFGGTWFRMQAVSMNGFIFVWSLHSEIGNDGSPLPRLNVYVP